MRRRDVITGLTAAAIAQPMAAGATGQSEADHAAAVEAVAAARKAYWSAIGPVDADVIAYIISPQFMDAPPWPNTRQAYRIVRPPGSLIIVSDGMSDPYPAGGPPGPGFGCEVFIEVPELAGATFDEIRQSWAFAAVEGFAMNIAAVGGFGDALTRLGVISMELPLDNAPEAKVHANGSVGALINLPTPYPGKLLMPSGEQIDMVPLTLIPPADLDRVVRERARGRQRVAEARTQSGLGHRTYANR
jgi:hypothetical protein